MASGFKQKIKDWFAVPEKRNSFLFFTVLCGIIILLYIFSEKGNKQAFNSVPTLSYEPNRQANTLTAQELLNMRRFADMDEFLQRAESNQEMQQGMEVIFHEAKSTDNYRHYLINCATAGFDVICSVKNGTVRAVTLSELTMPVYPEKLDKNADSAKIAAFEASAKNFESQVQSINSVFNALATALDMEGDLKYNYLDIFDNAIYMSIRDKKSDTVKQGVFLL